MSRFYTLPRAPERERGGPGTVHYALSPERFARPRVPNSGAPPSGAEIAQMLEPAPRDEEAEAVAAEEALGRVFAFLETR